MARYTIDGITVNTALSKASWDEDTRWDGSNNISVATGSQWSHEALYLSRKDRYYLVCWSDWQGSRPSAHWLTEVEAARWLASQGHELPAELQQHADDVTE